MKSLDGLAVFVVVVEAGSFSAAARRLGNTPSAVSKQISLLEADLEAQLFHRTTRKQSLTEAGDILYHRARGIVADLEDARLAVRRLSDTPSGSLHITTEVDLALALLRPVLPAFLERYPKVQVRITMSTTLVDLVGGGLDLALRMGHLADSSLVARRLGVSRSVLCASPDYLKERGSPQAPTELSTHDCLSFRTRAEPTTWSFDCDGQVVDAVVDGSLKVDSLNLLRAVTMSGVGIAMLPIWMVRDALATGALVRVLTGYPLQPSGTPVQAVWANKRYLPAKVGAFVDFLVEHDVLAQAQGNR